MKKNKWFKHYNTASLGASFEKLRAARDFEAMACYWMLLELVSRHESEDRGTVELPKKLVHQYWNVSTHRATRIMGQLIGNFAETMRVETLEQSYKLSLSNWAELQENRGGKRTAKPEQNPERGKRGEVRGKKVEGEDAAAFQIILSQLPQVTKDELVRHYGLDYVNKHGVAAMLHYRMTDPNSHRWPPMKWGVVLAKWLKRQTEFDQQDARATGGVGSGLVPD